MKIKSKYVRVTIVLTVSLLLVTFFPFRKYSEMVRIYFTAGGNYNEIKRFLEMRNNDIYIKSATWLVRQMAEQTSYDDTVSREYYIFLSSVNDSTMDFKRKWLSFNSTCPITPHIQRDILTLNAHLLYSNTQSALDTWNDSPWKDSVSFDVFCNYILPYKIEKEPVVNWRKFYRDKYYHLIKGVRNMEEAFHKIYEYETRTFLVGNTYFPYAQDALLLDKLHRGNCKQRAFHMVYVMRALGIPASVDYTPVWSNYGNKGHYWVVMINKDNSVSTHSDNVDEYIDGAYEKTLVDYHPNEFTSSIDSLKKIAKIYRLTFCKSQDTDKRDSLINYEYMKSPYTCEVTGEYKYTTSQNVIHAKTRPFSRLYVCTYTQGDGWIPVGKAKRLNNKEIDVGEILHDNIIIVSEYSNGFFSPVSSPYLIRHNRQPLRIEPSGETENITIYRKYMLRNIWINRWAEIIGTKIETSNDIEFNCNIEKLYEFTKLPNSETCMSDLHGKLRKYLRIKPAQGVYPVFAEIKLFDKQNREIKDSLYGVYAVGESLTGDTVVTRKLHDNNLNTTFYKRFPFWIGMDISRVNDKIANIQLTMWNDENQIIKGHCYELFYYDHNKWKSLGKQKAARKCLFYRNVPKNSLLLLRDYTKGKEERIFLYENNKQIWY